MKVLILLLSLVATAQQLEAEAQLCPIVAWSRQSFAGYAVSSTLLGNNQVSAGPVVFLGNSITAVGKWQELLPEKTIINKGVSGDVTAGVLARLAEVVQTKPAKIFIMIGVNDIKVGTAENVIVNNYRAILVGLKQASPESEIYVQSVLPVNEAMLADIYRRITNEKIRQLNKLLKKLCRQHKVTFINLHPVLENTDYQLKKELSTDGLHLKPAAYEQWVNFLRNSNYL